MIVIENVSFLNKKENAKRLNESGYVSSVRLSRLDSNEAKMLGLDPCKLENVKNIKKHFEGDSQYKCICLNYGSGNVKYWYFLNDLKAIYGFSVGDYELVNEPKVYTCDNLEEPCQSNCNHFSYSGGTNTNNNTGTGFNIPKHKWSIMRLLFPFTTAIAQKSDYDKSTLGFVLDVIVWIGLIYSCFYFMFRI